MPIISQILILVQYSIFDFNNTLIFPKFDFHLDSHDGIGLGGGTESKLRKLKGDPITIDSHSLSVDLKRLKNQSEEEIVKLPIYDRANTHDPIPNQQPVLPSHKFIILEGLYLAVKKNTQKSQLIFQILTKRYENLDLEMFVII